MLGHADRSLCAGHADCVNFLDPFDVLKVDGGAITAEYDAEYATQYYHTYHTYYYHTYGFFRERC